MESTSITHHNHVVCDLRSLKLEKPACRNMLSRVRYRVTPIQGGLTVSSFTIHNWSSGLGRVIVGEEEGVRCASLNEFQSSSLLVTASWD